LNPRKFLFLPSNQTALHGMTYLYLEAEKRGHVCTLLIEPRLSQCCTLNIIQLGIPGRQSSPFTYLGKLSAFMPEMIKKYLRPIKKKIMNWVDRDHKKKIQNWISIQIHREREVETILDREKPDIIYTYGDRHSGYEPALIKIANKKNIPVIIPPIAYPSENKALVNSIKRHSSVHSLFYVTKNAEFKNQYPQQWVYDDETGEDLSYFPVWMVKARDQCGVLPENPWTLGCGDSNYICADGDEARDRFILNGVDPEKIRVTGHPEHDSLYSIWQQKKSKKKELSEEYNLRPNTPLLIVALPQTLEHNILPKREHWQLQDHLCAAATQTNWNVLLSLHPKMEQNRYAYLEKRYSVKIAEERLRKILPLADLYLVGQGSSTVLWAVLCELPIVIADWYGPNYSPFNWLEGINIVKDAGKLQGVLTDLTSNDSNFFESMKDSHRRQKHIISPFDGKCTERIFNLN
jgi:hypothetical protein